MGSGTSATKTDCDSTFDRCSTTTAGGVVLTACNKESVLTAAGFLGDGCKKKLLTETCVCASDYCNDPSKKSSASTQSAFKLVAMIAVSCMIKILLA
jgi:hypothetical protein